IVSSVTCMLLRQLPHGVLKFRGDESARAFFGRHRSIIARRADDQAHFTRFRPAVAFRPGAESAVQITRENRNVSTSHERANATLEFIKLSRGGASSFRKNDQDVAGIRKKLTTDRETLADMSLAR